ncbi:BnaUnng04350D [Brassica napus]|uniref:BnaUnng04350D protein n=2 Tax=Brassica TaxID=3705 RepID=A0A078JV40_BRANA|nr:BnaUnng04350D [Brassica napus]
MNSISSFPKDLMKTLKRIFYETRETRDVNETRDLNQGGELIEVDILLDEKSSLIKISVSVHRLNTFRELLKEGALYELSGFDVTRRNNHFKLCNSNVAIRLNQSTKMVEVPAVANPR